MAILTKAGRYEIIEELGRGAMGIVYKAMDPVIGRNVAVKTIRLSTEGTGLTRPELLTRFQTEARAAGLLTHANIVVVFDAGEEDGLYFITMELVEGKSLQALLDGGHVFALPRVLRIMEQTCGALQFAHEHNVVHRDIKPANLMLTADDTVKVTDFGTAKILQFGTVQQTTHVMGTPSYMSPEQVKGRAVDGRSDIFSLGVVLYEMVTGEKPFPGQNITTVIYKIVNEQPIPPRQIEPSIHPGISAVILKALAKQPEERYQSCREMLEDLRNYRSIVVYGADPDATVYAAGRSLIVPSVAFEATQASSPAVEDPLAATARSLTSRVAHPGQTPAIRRTGTLPPYQEPKKKNLFATILAALFLLGVIFYGARKLRPVFEDARQLRAAQSDSTSQLASLPTESRLATSPANSNSNEALPTNAEAQALDLGKDPHTVAASDVGIGSTEVKLKENSTKSTLPKKIETALNPRTAEYKSRIEQAIATKGLNNRVSVQGVGNTLTLAGKLHPGEHGALLNFLRNAPGNIHIIDHIEYDDTPAATLGNQTEGAHPIPGPGRGAIHIVTDVIGASAVLRGPAGHVRDKCQTPCSFNNLNPARYTVEVQKDGYQPLQAAAQVSAGGVVDEKLKLEFLARGLYLISQPAGADVFINGTKQFGQTPLTLPLARGQYNVVLRLEGYESYTGSAQINDNIQTELEVKLKEKSANRVAWAQVDSNPAGAEIIVDGVSAGQSTPARIQLTSGFHTVTLKLGGYQPVQRRVEVTEGGTVSLSVALNAR
ncbi:MAG TPA: serine/threonine-protein kinase [Candidatus Dormibacteraeota bacterium]|nr:serine/threonine-protein kinase [Candidatus Dormibacteraeota bacterium]